MGDKGGMTPMHWGIENLLGLREYGEWIIWNLSWGLMPMLTGPFIAIPPPLALADTHSASAKLGPGRKNYFQSFPTHCALDNVHRGSEYKEGEHSNPVSPIPPFRIIIIYRLCA